jgi:hypothetical protein
MAKPARRGAKNAEGRRKRGTTRKRKHEALFGEASLSEEKKAHDRQPAAKPEPF